MCGIEIVSALPLCRLPLLPFWWNKCMYIRAPGEWEKKRKKTRCTQPWARRKKIGNKIKEQREQRQRQKKNFCVSDISFPYPCRSCWWKECLSLVCVCVCSLSSWFVHYYFAFLLVALWIVVLHVVTTFMSSIWALRLFFCSSFVLFTLVQSLAIFFAPRITRRRVISLTWSRKKTATMNRIK